MATPLVPSAAKVVTKNGAKPDSIAGGTRSIQNIQRHHHDIAGEDRTEQNARVQQIVPQNIKQLASNPLANAALENIAENADEVISKVVAATAASEIFVSCIGFYIIQFTMWLISISGVGIETIPGITGLHIGMAIYTLGLLIILMVGWGTMIYAAVIFTMNGVHCFGGWKGIIFIFCAAAYGIVIINAIPWFVVWIGAVVLLEKPQEGG